MTRPTVTTHLTYAQHLTVGDTFTHQAHRDWWALPENNEWHLSWITATTITHDPDGTVVIEWTHEDPFDGPPRRGRTRPSNPLRLHPRKLVRIRSEEGGE